MRHPLKSAVESERIIVSEPQVLLATSDWLLERRILPLVYSISGGSPDEREALKRDIRHRYEGAFKSLGKPMPEIFSGAGPDIEAVSLRTDSTPEWWRIECKGSGKGKNPTLENKFFLGLGKTVSYWTDELLPNRKDARLFLGYALPDTEIYLRKLQQRVCRPLRKHLNLWILLYETSTAQIRPIPPDEEIQ